MPKITHRACTSYPSILQVSCNRVSLQDIKHNKSLWLWVPAHISANRCYIHTPAYLTPAKRISQLPAGSHRAHHSYPHTYMELTVHHASTNQPPLFSEKTSKNSPCRWCVALKELPGRTGRWSGFVCGTFHFFLSSSHLPGHDWCLYRWRGRWST